MTLEADEADAAAKIREADAAVKIREACKAREAGGIGEAGGRAGWQVGGLG